MISHFYKLLTVVLALGTAGAQVVCGCPAPRVEVAKTCTEKKPCCKKSEAPVEKKDPCESCTIKHRPQQAMPDGKVGVEIGQLAVCDFVIPQVGVVNVAGVQSARVEGIPAPPLLFDLFHVHSLLLN